MKREGEREGDEKKEPVIKKKLKVKQIIKKKKKD